MCELDHLPSGQLWHTRENNAERAESEQLATTPESWINLEQLETEGVDMQNKPGTIASQFQGRALALTGNIIFVWERRLSAGRLRQRLYEGRRLTD